jgi:hypothetical protein
LVPQPENTSRSLLLAVVSCPLLAVVSCPLAGALEDRKTFFDFSIIHVLMK